MKASCYFILTNKRIMIQTSKTGLYHNPFVCKVIVTIKFIWLWSRFGRCIIRHANIDKLFTKEFVTIIKCLNRYFIIIGYFLPEIFLLRYLSSLFVAKEKINAFVKLQWLLLELILSNLLWGIFLIDLNYIA